MTRASTIERRERRAARTYVPLDDDGELGAGTGNYHRRAEPTLDDLTAEDDAPRWELYMRRAGIVFVAFLVMAFAIALRTARAQESTIADDLALAVAKVAANEASLALIEPVDVDLVWQVTEARAPSTIARLRWLRAHSSCVLSDRPMSEAEARGNCRWSRHLGDDAREPEGWPDGPAWSRYAERWAQVRERARRLVVDGQPYDRPCPGDPFSWGGPMDADHARAAGLVALGCRDPRSGRPTRNEGYALRSGS